MCACGAYGQRQELQKRVEGLEGLGPEIERLQAELEQLEVERFDLCKDAEQRGPIFKPTGEHGLVCVQLRHHRGKGG